MSYNEEKVPWYVSGSNSENLSNSRGTGWSESFSRSIKVKATQERIREDEMSVTELDAPRVNSESEAAAVFLVAKMRNDFLLLWKLLANFCSFHILA